MIVRILIGAMALYLLLWLFGEKSAGKAVLGVGVKISIFIIIVGVILGIFYATQDNKMK